MPEALRVLPSHRWPSGSGRPLAILALEPPALSARTGVKFTRDVDGLGEILNAYVEVAPGTVVALRRHNQDTVPGTALIVDSRADSAVTLAVALAVLGVSQSEIAWHSTES